MSQGKFLLGLVAGAAAGAALGILFAPAKGSDTRRKLAKRSGDYADDLKNTFSEKLDDIIGTVTDVFDTAKDEAETFVSGKSQFDGAKNPSQGNQKYAHSNANSNSNSRK